jgi:hypothetical protein
MVWLEKRDVEALAAPLAMWNHIRDGRDLSGISRPTVGFRVTQPFTSPNLKSRFMPGMQGQVLSCSGDAAYVQVRDLFDAKGLPLKDWIHHSCIEIGTRQYGTWEIDTCMVPRIPSRLTSSELDLLEDPNYKHIALGISTFLRTLAKTKPPGISSENLERLGGQSGSMVPWITTKIIDGIRNAGLISVLNNPDFTTDELAANATMDCATSSARNECGFYMRRYTGTDMNRTKKSCSFYVGQSADLNKRYHKWSSEGHEDLTKHSDSIAMHALCLVPKVFFDDHKYIVEQLFTSLFQTYKGEIINRTRAVDLNDAQNQFHVKNCYDMNNIATEAAKESGWTGAVQRRSFWEGSFSSCEGLNWQSPISEAPAYESSVWLRTDGFMPDPENGNKAVPISNFTREVPKKMQVIQPSKGQKSQDPAFVIFHLQSENKDDYQMRISRTLPGNTSKDGVTWPAEGTYFDLTFEVRTDWKPHPYSWARLPLFGPFGDWDRANSWALSINWKDPSGNHRSKYLHCERPHAMMSESNGSIVPYVRGIEVRVLCGLLIYGHCVFSALKYHANRHTGHPLAVQGEDPGEPAT